MKKTRQTSLFSEGRYNSMNVYHKASRKTGRRGGYIPFVKTALLVCVAYIIWLVLHEFIHYYFCLVLGGTASMPSILPTPQVSCKSMPFDFAQSFLYAMSPHIAAIMVMIVVSRLSDGFLKFLAYAAFFDLQFNLFLTTIFGPVLDGRKNDLFYLLDNINDRVAASVSVGLVLFIILLSYSVFIRGGYLRGLMEEKYRNAFIILSVISLGNLLTLYFI